MIEKYVEKRTLGMFLSSFFRPVRGSTGGTGKTITWDSVRYTDKIAGTVDRNTGSNLNTTSIYSSKELTPPEYSEAVAIDVNDLVERMAGEDPFSASNRSFSARFISKMTEGVVEMTDKVNRAVELNAAQVLQTGTISLDGARPFAADFKPKATHFPTVATTWDNSGTATPLDDIEALANVIKTDSRKIVRRCIMGRTALREFIETDQVIGRADSRRMNLIDINPDMQRRGANFWGTIQAGEFEVEIWGYTAEYEPFDGSPKTTYVDENKVILLPDEPALVVASLQVPKVLPPDPRLAQLVTPPTVSEVGFDITPNLWCTPEGDVVYAGVKARPVLFPQGVDEFGALST